MPPNAPRYTFDASLGRFRDARGRLVSAAFVRNEVEAVIRAGTRDVQALSAQLRSGAIDLTQWRAGMAENVKMAHLSAAMVAKGGRSQMQAADWGRTGQAIRTQYTYLDRFTFELATGVQRPDGRMDARAAMYVKSARASFFAAERATSVDAGRTEERNILMPGESCPDCIAETALGWVPIGTLSHVGDRQCRSNDRCHVVYRGATA